MLFTMVASFAWAEPAWTPLRVAVECESGGRIDACTHVRGLLDHQSVFAVGPRATSMVNIHIAVTTEANRDLVLLRFVGSVEGAPPSYEQQIGVDSRLPVEEQAEALAPGLWRGLSPFVAIVVPEALTVSYAAPESSREVGRTTPWGFNTWTGGWGSWSEQYQSLNLWGGASVYRITNDNAFGFWGGTDRDIQRQPALQIDGQSVPISEDEYSVYGMGTWSYNLDKHRGDAQAWTIGLVARGGMDDPDGQYAGTARTHVGIERNWFPSNDPRGNRLAAAWLIGGQADWYNQVNSLGQREAIFPTHMLLAGGQIRVDTVELGVDLAAKAELLHPLRRYTLSADTWTDLKLGDHVDLNLSLGVTRQAIPGPASVDLGDYSTVTRLDYAEPLQIYSNVNLRLHWDNTNSARNNRFSTGESLDATGNL